jgi:hypothetical protein
VVRPNVRHERLNATPSSSFCPRVDDVVRSAHGGA